MKKLVGVGKDSIVGAGNVCNEEISRNWVVVVEKETGILKIKSLTEIEIDF